MNHLPSRPNPADAQDAAHWEAVEEASELLHEERFREALEVLRDILRKDAKNPYAFFLTGIALYEVGELEPSRDAYRACLNVAPKHLGARVALSHVLRTLGDTKSAIREGMEALSQSPGDGDALHAVGLAYLARGETVAAERYLKAFLDTNPEYEVSEDVKGILEQMKSSPPS
ncbi:tetratricopeptide repeat protein [Pendulispora albinea]|uniref:Tetratricopeptide repeat protein n=1 Tax=Pendulispora albinea TaxID=2741071 RepID=A0ABZ2LMT8_9BACT